MLQDEIYHSQIALDILQNDFHRPFVNGRCNRERIEDEIVIGIYKGELSPMNQEDVDFICSLIDSLITELGNGKGADK